MNPGISARAHDSLKRSINAPCLFIERVKGQETRRAPAVDCEWNCDTCGFNPQVKERRLCRLGYRENDS